MVILFIIEIAGLQKFQKNLKSPTLDAPRLSAPRACGGSSVANLL